MTKFEKMAKRIKIEKSRFYSSVCSYISFKHAEIETDSKERDMLLYKSYRYGQIAKRML